MPFLLVMILCCKLISYCLVRGAPIAEDVPHNPVVALHGEEVEGAVWRVEREGRVDFLAKYVRPDKIDGKYFPQISGQAEIWFIDRDSHSRE